MIIHHEVLHPHFPNTKLVVIGLISVQILRNVESVPAARLVANPLRPLVHWPTLRCHRLLQSAIFVMGRDKVVFRLDQLLRLTIVVRVMVPSSVEFEVITRVVLVLASELAILLLQ